MLTPDVFHDHPACQATEASIELNEDGYCQSCLDKWWDEIEAGEHQRLTHHVNT